MDDEIILRSLVIVGTLFMNEPSLKSDRYITSKLGDILSRFSKRTTALPEELQILVLQLQSFSN